MGYYSAIKYKNYSAMCNNMDGPRVYYMSFGFWGISFRSLIHLSLSLCTA